MKIVGQLVCGPGEADRYLEDTLKEFKRLTDETIVCLCNAGEKEKELVERYGFQHYEDNREWGRWQYEIKTGLLARIRESVGYQPEYILALDADETVPTLDRTKLERIAEGRESCHLYVVNLWNDESRYSKALSFWNVRVYRMPSEGNSQFTRKPVHCGNAPPVAYAVPPAQSYVPHILLHKGLMKKEDRMRKVERYQRYDPNAIHKGREYYDALSHDGPGSPYVQEEVIAKITAYCENLRPKVLTRQPMPIQEKKFYYVRRIDDKHLGSVTDIPAEHLDMTLKNHPTWQVIDDTEREIVPPVTIEEAPKADPFACLFCGYAARSLAGKKAHERIKHP